MSKLKWIVIFSTALVVLMAGTVVGEIPDTFKGKALNQVDLITLLLSEHDAGRDTVWGNYQLMVLSNQYTRSNQPLNNDYTELRAWVLRNK